MKSFQPPYVSIHIHVSIHIFADINITDITASRGTDYFIPDSIELTAGVQNGAIAITIIRDNLIEDLESFTVEIVNVSSPAVINSGRVIVTIEDDDFGEYLFLITM